MCRQPSRFCPLPDRSGRDAQETCDIIDPQNLSLMLRLTDQLDIRHMNLRAAPSLALPQQVKRNGRAKDVMLRMERP